VFGPSEYARAAACICVNTVVRDAGLVSTSRARR
jgi:hypothetical protein